MEGKILKANLGAGQIVRQQVISAAEQAERLVADAEATSEQIREEAWREGYTTGLREWEAALEEARAQGERYRKDGQADFVRLAIKIAGKILGEELQAAPERVAVIVGEALKSVTRERTLTIRVAPGAAAVLTPHLARLRERLPQDCSVRVAESAEITQGGCIIVSELGAIDARVEVQLEMLERALLHEVRA